MKVRRLVALSALVLAVSGCGGGQKDKPVAEVQPGPASTRQPPKGTPQATPQATRPPSGGGDATPAVAMTLDEAKAQCAGCHQPGGSGAGVWSTAAGSLEDWKLFAAAAKSSVEAGRMPLGTPLSADEKKRLLAFLDGLLGGDPSQPSELTFETASVLCTGCHSSSAPSGQRVEPYLQTLAQWQDEKSDIREAVSSGWMPLGKPMTDAERAALLRFIDRLGGSSGGGDDDKR